MRKKIQSMSYVEMRKALIKSRIKSTLLCALTVVIWVAFATGIGLGTEFWLNNTINPDVWQAILAVVITVAGMTTMTIISDKISAAINKQFEMQADIKFSMDVLFV